MLKLMSCLLTIAVAQTLPFWKSKAKVYERVQNREVIVSVTALDHTPEVPRYTLRVVGGGQSRVPCDFVFIQAENYEETARLSGYVTQAKFNPETRVMNVTVEAFFHSASMQIAVQSHPAPERKLDFTMLTGAMRGFQWALSFADLNSGICEIAIDGSYLYDQFPIPRLFLEFGMEAVFKRMAERLREQVEAHWKVEKANTAQGNNPIDKPRPLMEEFDRLKKRRGGD